MKKVKLNLVFGGLVVLISALSANAQDNQNSPSGAQLQKTRIIDLKKLTSTSITSKNILSDKSISDKLLDGTVDVTMAPGETKKIKDKRIGGFHSEIFYFDTILEKPNFMTFKTDAVRVGTISGTRVDFTLTASNDATDGNYKIRVKYSFHNAGNVLSTEILTINLTIIESETVSKPNKPGGPANGKVGQRLSFSTGGSSSNLGHSLEFKFDWGDGIRSSWGSSTRSYSYNNTGTKSLKARTRCKTHTSEVSGWSSTKSVAISYCSLNVTISPSGAGSVNKSPNKTNYTYNENVKLTANAKSGYQFDHWSGDLSGSNNPTNLAMKGDKSIQVYFKEESTQSRIIRVPDDYTTIQEGIDAASSGDTVLVAAGTYHENNIRLKAGVVVSGAGMDLSIVDGDGTTVFWGADGAVLDGFTIINGERGIFCWSTTPIITNNKITNCENGISVADNAIIQNNIIINNSDHGIFCGDNSPLIANNLIVNSEGALVSVSSDFIAWNNTIDSNESGIWVQRGLNEPTTVSAIAINNIITNNSYYGVYLSSSSEYGIDPAYMTIKHNNVWNNYYNYSSNWTPDPRDISANPLFVAPGSLAKKSAQFHSDTYKVERIIEKYNKYKAICEAKNKEFLKGSVFTTQEINAIESRKDLKLVQVNPSDYHLQEGSPCIGVGINSMEIDGNWYYVPSTDIEGNPRPNPSGSDSDMGAYENPLGQESIPLDPIALEKVCSGEEFWVDINLGSESNPVSDLKIVSFELQYTNTSIIDYIDYEVGPFLTAAQATVIPEALNGKISVSVYRISGGNSGDGVVLRLKFKILNIVSVKDSVCFSFTGVQANNSSGGKITLLPGTLCTKIDAGIPVWTGDADNNGQVNIFDINPIIVYWNKTGSARAIESCEWFKQYCCPPWDPIVATYADCNGSGKVDIFDINCVKINFGKTHTLSNALFSFYKNELSKSLSEPPIFVEARDYDDITHDFWLDINVGTISQPVNDLKVVSFELTYSNTENIDYVTYEVGEFPSGAQAKVIPDAPIGKVSASIYRTSGGDSGSGTVLSLKFNAEKGHTVIFNFDGVMANSSDGSTIPLSTEKDTVITSVKKYSNLKPNEFSLLPNYPNPFNPETTIQYQLPKISQVRLVINNLAGQRVATLVDEQQPAGFYSVQWNGKDDSGRNVASGVYLYRLKTKEFVQVKKMALVR